MAGRPGRSGGHNRIPLAQHVLRGTFNVTRHGRRVAAIAGAPAWQPSAPQLAALDVEGRAFLDRLRATYDLTLVEGELALEASVAVDRLNEIRLTRREASPKDQRALDKGEQEWQKRFASLLLALRVTP